MDNVRSADARYRFSPGMEKLKEDVLNRLLSRIERENTRVTPPDGKTPFLDVFEAMPDAGSCRSL